MRELDPNKKVMLLLNKADLLTVASRCEHLRSSSFWAKPTEASIDVLYSVGFLLPLRVVI